MFSNYCFDIYEKVNEVSLSWEQVIEMSKSDLCTIGAHSVSHPVYNLLTKENIGKPVAIVIAKQIVSIPTVNSEIIGGKASISGDFSEKEIDKMIEILREK